MESKLRLVRVAVVVLMVVALAATLLFPPSVYLDQIRLSAETRAMLESHQSAMATLGGPAGPVGPIPEFVKGQVLGRVPVWEAREGKVINWTGWTSEEDRLAGGTSATSFTNGVLFQVLVIVLIGALILSVINRRLTPKPAVATDADEAPVEPAPAEEKP